MPTFAHSPEPDRRTRSTPSPVPVRSALKPDREAIALPQIERAVGSQTGPGLSRPDVARRETRSASSPAPLLGHDFSRIPLHPEPPSAIQAKLAISTPGDAFEQEADRVTEQVMRTPEPPMQRNDSGAEGSRVRPSDQPARDTLPHRGRPGSGEEAKAAIPSVLGESALAGRPLDRATLAFMEARFGHKFGGVRVHADGAAAAAARAIRARAFTFGRDIVFASGEYAPATTEGKQLLAHELTHVVQQGASLPMAAGASTALSSGSQLLQRAPDKKSDTGIGVPEDLLLHSTAVWPKGLSYEQRIAMLAANPDHAQGEWKKLSQGDQFAVIINMARFYGEPFSRQFLDHRKSGKKLALGYTFVGPETKSADLVARGYRMAGIQHQMDVEIWFHPSGTRLHRGIAAAKPKEVKREEPPPKEEESEEEPPEEIIDVEDVDPSDLQEQALALLDELRKLNREMEELLKAEPVDMEEFVDKASDFSDLRREIHDLIVQDPTILEDVTGASIRDERKALVEWFLKLKEKAYGTEMPDFNKPSSE